MPKKVGVVCVTLGAVLILLALLLLGYNQYEDYRAGQEAERLLNDMLSALSENDETQPPVEEPSKNISSDTWLLEQEMPVIELDGYEYIGYLSIPSLELNLPIMSEWDYARLKIAPCRQFGSIRTNDMVIAAHNYKKHFGSLNQLQTGDMVKFTDVDGIVNNYEVDTINVLKPTAVDEVQNSEYDLILYTCTLG